MQLRTCRTEAKEEERWTDLGQTKWVKGSGKSEKSFMGGESFQGVGSGDGVDLVLGEVDFRRGDL